MASLLLKSGIDFFGVILAAKHYMILTLTYLTDPLRQLMAGTTTLHPLWLDSAVLGERLPA